MHTKFRKLEQFKERKSKRSASTLTSERNNVPSGITVSRVDLIQEGVNDELEILTVREVLHVGVVAIDHSNLCRHLLDLVGQSLESLRNNHGELAERNRAVLVRARLEVVSLL